MSGFENKFNTNNQTALFAVSNADGTTPVYLWADPSTHALITSGGGGGGGSDVQYSEGTTTSPATGTLSLARYSSTPPTLTNGQMYGLQLDSAGNLKVSGSLSVGGTTDNSAYTAGSSTGTPTFGFYHSTIDTVTDGRSASVAITSKRALMVNLQTAAGVEIGTAASPIQVSLANTATNATAVKVDGSGFTQPISGSVNATLAAETTKVIGTVNQGTSPWVVSGSVTTGGLTDTQLRASAVPVSLTSTTVTNTVAVSNAGTFATQVTSLPALSTGSNTIGAISNTSFTVTQATGTNLHTVVDSGTITSITNTVATAEVAPTTVLNGKTTVTTAGTRVVLAASTTVKSVTIKALGTNTGIIYVGSSTVASTNGLQLYAGESISLDISNLNTVNIDASVSGEGVSYLGVN